jgi:hypothetical protein
MNAFLKLDKELRHTCRAVIFAAKGMEPAESKARDDMQRYLKPWRKHANSEGLPCCRDNIQG